MVDAPCRKPPQQRTAIRMSIGRLNAMGSNPVLTTKIKDMENRSYRGTLIEAILKPFVEDNLYESVEGFKEALQKELDLNLKFSTTVSDVKTVNGFNTGEVYFESEDKEPRVVLFTIVNSPVRT